MGIIKNEKERLEFEAAVYQRNIETWSIPWRKYVAPALAVGGGAFLLYIAGKKVFKKRKPKPLFHNLKFQSPVEVRKKKRVRIAKKVLGVATPIALALVRTSLTAFVKKSINKNGTTQRNSG